MEQHLKCPRCNSLDTKFCYNNNHNKNQPRYLCRTCERHWTQGGSLRDIPVGGGHRKAKCTANSAPSSTSIVPPPPQSLQQVVVQNQLVSPPVNPISQLFHQSQNDGAVNDVHSFNRWVSSLPISLNYHQGSGDGAGAWYLSALAGDHSLSPSSQVSFNQSQNVSSVNVLASHLNELVSPPLPINNTYHHHSARGGAQDGYLSSLEGAQSVNASSQISLNGGSVNELESPSLPITNTYHHGISGGGAQDGYLSSLAVVQSVNASSQVSFNQTLNGGSVNEFVSPSLQITNPYHHGNASGGAQDGYLSALVGDHSLSPSSQVSFNQSQNVSSVNGLASHFNELVSPSLPINNTYHHRSARGRVQDGYLSSLAGVQSVNGLSQVSSNHSLNGGGVNELVSPFSEMVSLSLPITNTNHLGSASGGDQDGYLSSLEGVQSMNASPQVSFNQSLNGGSVNDLVSPFRDLTIHSLPITSTYHHGSASGGAQDGYLSSLAGVQSMNTSSQVSLNHSLNRGGVNELVSPFNEMVSNSLPITNTYHHGSDGVGAQDGFLSSLAGLQPVNASSQVYFNQSVNGGRVNELVSTFSDLTIHSLPITNTYHHGSAYGAQDGYLSSLGRVHSLDPSSQASNQTLNGVVGSSDLALLSGFNVADSHASASQHGIESQYEDFLQSSLADDRVAIAFHYPDRWPQNFINSDNNMASDDISWGTMLDITSNINGNSDHNISMPNHGSGLPGYGTPPQY